jgi:hypothetical protein
VQETGSLGLEVVTLVPLTLIKDEEKRMDQVCILQALTSAVAID